MTDEDEMIVKDSNGARLKEGDNVSVIKDLKVKSGSSVVKRGTIVRGIRLTNNPEEIEGKVDKRDMVLKTCFVRKA